MALDDLPEEQIENLLDNSLKENKNDNFNVLE